MLVILMNMKRKRDGFSRPSMPEPRADRSGRPGQAALALLALTIGVLACSGEGTGLQARLVAVEELDLTHDGVLGAVRPDGVCVPGRCYLGFTRIDPDPQAFGLLQLDADLAMQGMRTIVAQEGEGDLAPTAGLPTDLRLLADGRGALWAPFEIAYLFDPTTESCRNCLHVARYEPTGEGLELAGHRELVCHEWDCPPEGIAPRPTGMELSDDPAPFEHDGRFYSLQRRWGTASVHVRPLGDSLEPLPEFELDLTPVLGPAALSVFTAVHIEEAPWLIGAAYDGPPSEEGASSYLVAVPLGQDLREPAGPAVVLSMTQEYQYYVSGARVEGGRLYTVFNILSRVQDGPSQGVLAVFDVGQGFHEVQRELINEGLPGPYFMDNHLTVEVVEGRVLVFYPTEEGRLKVRIFAWE